MSAPAPLRLDDLVLAATVARRYFLEDRTKVQIAAELSLSRFKVARLIDLARSSGIVRITIATPGAVDTELSVLLREHLGLGRALVVNTVDDGDNGATEVTTERRHAAISPTSQPRSSTRCSPLPTCSASAGRGPCSPPRRG